MLFDGLFDVLDIIIVSFRLYTSGTSLENILTAFVFVVIEKLWFCIWSRIRFIESLTSSDNCQPQSFIILLIIHHLLDFTNVT